MRLPVFLCLYHTYDFALYAFIVWGGVYDLLLTITIEPPLNAPLVTPEIPAALYNMTIESALEAGNGMLFYINTTTNYEKYIEQCQPTSCTYYDSSFINRVIHAVTLASALVGLIIRLMRPVFASASTHCSGCIKGRRMV